MSSPPTCFGMLTFTATPNCTPYGRNTSAMRASCAMKSESRMWRSAFTLLTLHPLMPTDASNLAYSAARVRSGRTLPFSKKIDRPA